MTNPIKPLRPFLPLLCAVVMLSCKDNYEAPIQEEAWVPIYLSNEEAMEITTLEPREPIKGGKIYVYGDYLFQLEPNLGIHVYELVDKQPTPLRFIQVFGAQEIAIRNGILYTNNENDIVSIELTENGLIRVAGRVENVFRVTETPLPPSEGYFECVDRTKGTVIGWELKEHVRAQCKF